VANRLFVSLPLPTDLPSSQRERAALLDESIRTLDTSLLRVNRQSVVMDGDHLRDILSVTAIAGRTPEAPKMHALWTLLLATSLFEKGDKFRLLTSLNTDATTAQVLIREKLRLNRQGEDLKSWYKDALRILFPKRAGQGSRAHA